jgi:hypothetical protein
MRKVAHWLASQGYTLRSGGADGADRAFEAGAGKIYPSIRIDGLFE